MLRFSSYTACVLVLSVGASGQKSELRSFQRVDGPVRDAGVLHVATGTWTRHNGSASLGAGGNRTVVNTCKGICVTAGPATGSYYGAIDPGMTWTASARLPSTTSPDVNWNPIAAPVGSAVGSAHGCQDSYTISGYQIAYCSDAPAAATRITINFYNQVWVGTPTAVCLNPTAPPPIATHVYTNLPGQPGLAQACWAVTFDLSGAGSPNAPFAMMADGDGVYSAGTDDAFVWSFTFPSVTVSTAATGMFLGGSPSDGTSLGVVPPDHNGIGWKQFPPATTVEAAGYDGTRFDRPPLTGAPLGGPDVNYPANGADGINSLPGHEDGTDMLGADGFRIEGGALTPGCYYFGGPSVGPYAGFCLGLYADTTCVPPEPGTSYCAGDGVDPNVTQQSCPCANFGALGRGCASSFNTAGAKISGSGVVATDGTMPVGMGVVLSTDGMNLTAGQSCIFLKGDTDDPDGVQGAVPPLAFGDGTRCATGSLIRLRTEPITPHILPLGGTSSFPMAGDPQPLSVRGATPVGSGLTGYYTCYYRNAAAGFCPAPAGGTFNTANGYKITW